MELKWVFKELDKQLILLQRTREYRTLNTGQEQKLGWAVENGDKQV